MPYILLLIYLAAAFVIQLLTGDFPVTFFAFPLNFIIAVIWLGGMLWIWKGARKSQFVAFMLSKGASVSAVAMFLMFSLVIGLTGIRSLVNSWVFVAFMLYFQTVLLFVVMRGWRAQTATGAHLGKIRWRFILNHAGLLLAISSAFWGAPDSETLRFQAYRDVPVCRAFGMDGEPSWLSSVMELKDFKVELHDNGVPAMYEAEILIDGEPVTLKVNHPYSMGLGKNVYLSGYGHASGESESCIIQIVTEPWKYGAVIGMGMMIAGALLLFVGGPKKRYTEEG